MDKKVSYTQIIREVISELIELRERANAPVAGIPVIDEERGHFMLFMNSWQGSRRTYGCYLHIDLSDDGKVWLQYDGTDMKIGQKLLDKGVDKQDLVLGWIAPYRRADTGMAVG